MKSTKFIEIAEFSNLLYTNFSSKEDVSTLNNIIRNYDICLGKRSLKDKFINTKTNQTFSQTTLFDFSCVRKHFQHVYKQTFFCKFRTSLLSLSLPGIYFIFYT